MKANMVFTFRKNRDVLRRVDFSKKDKTPAQIVQEEIETKKKKALAKKERKDLLRGPEPFNGMRMK